MIEVKIMKSFKRKFSKARVLTLVSERVAYGGAELDGILNISIL
jgi:ribosomal protein S21